ncbi:zinc ribbon domain-containing protein [bacterium]|nr:zinc ribbon domain-containing protein [bacterium]
MAQLRCPTCDREISSWEPVCGNCGTRQKKEGADTKNCPFCREVIPATAKICGICNTNLENPFPALVAKSPKNPIFSCFESAARIFIAVFAILFLIGVIAGIMEGVSHGGKKEHARKKHCYANMRVLLGAVEMYNMDSSILMTDLDEKILVEKGYLKSDPNCPESGNRYVGSRLEKDGKIICVGGTKAHGTVD